MAATILDAVTLHTADTIPNLVVSAGSQRRAFCLAVYSHGSNAAPPTGMTAGGQTMNVLATVDDDGTAFDICCTLFELNEAGVAAMSGNTIVPTGGTYNNRQFITWSVQGADQGTITPATAATSGTSGSVSLVRVADSYTVAFTCQDYTGTAFTGLANPSEAGEASFTNADIAYGYGADTSRTASFTWTHSTSRNNVTIAINVAPYSAPAGPTVSNLSDSTPNYQGSLTITGTGFPTSQSGSAGITIGGVAQTVTWNTSTSCSISSIARGTLKYGVSVDLVVTDAAGNASSGYATTLSPKTGWSYVNLSAPLADLGKRLRTSPDLDGTEQIEYGDYQGTGTGEVFSSAAFRMQAGVTGFYYAANDGVSGYADAVLQMVGGAGGGAGLLILQTAIRNATRDCYRDIVRG